MLSLELRLRSSPIKILSVTCRRRSHLRGGHYCAVMCGVTGRLPCDGTRQARCYRRYRARKSRTTLQSKVGLKVLPEQLTLFVNTSVTFKKCIIQ